MRGFKGMAPRAGGAPLRALVRTPPAGSGTVPEQAAMRGRGVIGATIITLIALLAADIGGGAHAGAYGIGTPASPAQISGWNIDIAPDGRNLPKGEGTLAAGKTLYDARCAACHGAKGEGGIGDRLAGGIGTLGGKKPIKTVGSFWPYATTLYDYIRRAMPLDAPQTLSDDQVYSVTAYVLSLNGLWPDGAPANAGTLLRIRMPNAGGFIADPRPDLR